MEKEVRMRAQHNWADQPNTEINKKPRPSLRLIVNPTPETPETPVEKAVQSVSSTTEVVLVILAQGILVIGLFLASNIMG
jgi:hypothetical protein